jgi:hypothetical protein
VYVHRALPGAEVYFVANVQERAIDMPVAFRAPGNAPQQWNPYTGEIHPLYEYEVQRDYTSVRLQLAPYASTVLVFTPEARPHVTHGSFAQVTGAGPKGLEALAARNGMYTVTPAGGAAQAVDVESLPAPYEIGGEWRLVLEGQGFPRTEKTLPRLASWTDDPATKYFSGTGRYTISFDVPPSYIAPDLLLQLSVGDVGNVADVTINGHHVGVIWMRGQTLDATSALQGGRNDMTVLVTNTLINRVAGWASAPPLPPGIQALYGRGIEDDTPQGRRLFGFSPLPRSGLLGPVVITPLKRVHVGWK